ncbi:fasciclin domain-containing protein [Nonomuraea sp. NPDC048916]|uniref:fasciclin domain-containing protein n=1 Tax=Nonomuraea sp. NPDC048916 TaxID=3154232 RepID=UPI0034066CC0
MTATIGTIGAPSHITPSPQTTTSTTSPTPTSGAGPVGPGCASVEKSLPSIADKPVGTALSEIPELSTLSQAVKKAGLEEKLNSAKAITLFAPDNQALQAIPADTRDKLMADKEKLVKILSYHVVEGKKTPAELTGATLKTLQGGELTVKGSGEKLMINNANVVCGGVPTRNAMVYIIDKVLMPS